jgi:hypothetical protein
MTCNKIIYLFSADENNNHNNASSIYVIEITFLSMHTGHSTVQLRSSELETMLTKEKYSGTS